MAVTILSDLGPSQVTGNTSSARGSDILILGPITFDAFSTPELMPWGGSQVVNKHRLLGGQRPIDATGPDDDDIVWHGSFFGNDAYQNCLALDALRIAGNQLPLSFGGQAYVVIITNFRPQIRKYPIWCDYSISCMIVFNGGQGATINSGTTPVGVDSLVSDDLSSMATQTS